MLRAILGNKSGRICVGEESVSVREIYKNREDMLTAAIVSRLTYLSDSEVDLLFNHIFVEANQDFHQISTVEFWPNFSSSIQERVEPDVIVHFDWGVMVIEVKRPHDSYQYAEQWIKELESLPYSYREGDIYFLSLGGSSANNTTELKRFEVLQSNFEDMNLPSPQGMSYQTWEGLINYLQARRDSGDLNRSDDNIIGDMIEALELYGVHTNIHSLKSLVPQHISTTFPALISHLYSPSLERKSESVMSLATLPVMNINWSNSIQQFAELEKTQTVRSATSLCNINERALKLWKI